MAVAIRLRRTGSSKRPRYRVVVADQRSPRDGRFIEAIGFYNPVPESAEIDIKLDRYDYWTSVGAKPTETVSQLVSKKRALIAS